MIRRAVPLVVALLVACGGDPDSATGPRPDPGAVAPTTASPTASATPSTASLPASVVTRLHVGRALGSPGFPAGWVVAFGSVWVPEGDKGQVTRFALPSGRQSVIKVGDPTRDAVGVDPSAASVAGNRIAVTVRADKAIALVDPATNTVVTTVDIGVSAYAVAVDGDTVWATDFDNGKLARASIRTGTVVSTVDVPGAEGVVTAAGAAWVASETGALYRVDATTGAMVAVPGIGGGNLETVAVGDGSVWALDKEAALVYRVDPRTSRVLAKVSVAFEEPGDAGICFGAGSLWVVGSPAGRNLTRISASNNRVTLRAALPVGTQACAYGASLVWTFSGDAASDGPEILGIDPREVA